MDPLSSPTGEAAASIVNSLRKDTVIVFPLDSIAANQVNQLTEREREVLMLVANGANNQEIAAQLFISEGTVKTHISSILSQLHLRDRTQLAIFVHQHKLL
jgi:DNA-binding NarL/FixJ family response regulator